MPESAALPEVTPPFILELRHENLQRSGAFTPSAAVLVTQSLPTSGLIQALGSEAFQTLLLVLSCVTANGSFVATPELLAPVINTSRGRMLARLQYLTDLRWRGEPLLLEHQTESGLHLFAPAPHLMQLRRNLIFPAPEPPGTALTMPEVLQEQDNPGHEGMRPREAVIAYSRAKYGRPRAEVEAQIERFLRGETEPSTPEEAARLQLRRKLMDYGVMGEQADRLLEAHPTEIIENQLAWLPHRHARNPAGLLISAIEGNYEPPLAVLHSHTESDHAPALMAKRDGDLTDEPHTPNTEVSWPLPNDESGNLS